jgi:hypothetical protein
MVENETAAKSYSDLIAAALAEIAKISDGDEYLRWFDARQPALFRQLDGFADVIEKCVNVMPLPCFETLLGVYVASHRHLHAMWRERERLDLLKTPTGAWTM